MNSGSNTDKIAQTVQAREAFYEDLQAGRLSLGEATRRMRKIAGMTQPEYARLIGIAPRVLMDIERGHGNPRLATLEKLAKPFGLRVAFSAPYHPWKSHFDSGDVSS